ncbi:VOC family protein [Amycolatopsis sp. Hca4]|uniref:VOC family protein n=1 Tax=unclassified Amycolatopsis TaxID=2618356 RepID=UPI0015914BC4|nr:VOC family protein [Amycolatopsis sp. Hca4]QKV73482.1 VOC family protein [Amycolatopsis sp. Hca4]
MEAAGLHAYLSYRDASAALGWLTAVGFEVVTRQDGDDGAVVHAEVRLGSIVLMVATADADYDRPRLLGLSTGDGLYLGFDRSELVDGWFGRAVAAGARPVIAPEDTAWGSRRARVLDPEGKEWSAGTYRPGTAW